MSWFEVHAESAEVDGAYAVVRLRAPAGDASPLHRHTRESETFVVVTGGLAVTVGDVEHVLGPGECVTGPVGVPHGYRVVGDQPATFLVVLVPGGFERAFRGMADGDEPGMDDLGVELLD